jgi:signal transduction histidine kinase
MPEPANPPRPLFYGFFQRFNIRGKIASIVLVTAVTALGVSFSLFAAVDLVTFHRATVRQLQIVAEVAAMNASAAIVFKDESAAGKILQSLSANPHILSATLYRSDKRSFAEFHPTVPSPHRHVFPEPAPTGSFSRHGIEVLVPVRVGEERVGWLEVRRDIKDYRDRFLLLVSVILLSCLVGAWLAFLVSTRFQGLIANPILDLAATAHHVSESKDFSLRARAGPKDELGILVRHFNEMMELIQQRDRDLQNAHDELESNVLKRTEELQREVEERKRDDIRIKELLWRIQDDNDKLLLLDREKNDFLANVSHELRTPLTSILGFLKLMVKGQSGPLTDTQTDFVQTSLSNAERLYSLVNDLLDMSKLEEGSLHLQYGNLDPQGLIEAVVKSLGNLAEAKSIRLSIQVRGGIADSVVDVEKFQRVLINLLSNAIKFTPTGGSVNLGAEPARRCNRSGVLFWVQDSGIGIPPEDLKKIFDKFYQVASHLTRTSGGTGLGLSIARKIITAHGGEIWAESRVGKGSTFYCFLPSQPPSNGVPLDGGNKG